MFVTKLLLLTLSAKFILMNSFFFRMNGFGSLLDAVQPYIIKPRATVYKMLKKSTLMVAGVFVKCT
ncbi:MAG: hypothetical protein EA408_10725 [Marinilabiliales bacterium]|nr:MAG: hypothetical protein EA408_10725 [Marinilabiliales bacterium]